MREMRWPLAIGATVAEVAGLVAAGGPAAAQTADPAKKYAIATETSSNYGTMLSRTDQPVSCVGSGFGFVYSDLWQGIGGDAGWVEAGTSFCDEGDPAAKYVWARMSPAGDYFESVFQRNAPTGTNVNWKIAYPDGLGWKVYTNGTVRAVYTGGNTSFVSNSADIGLEVHARGSSSMNTVASSALKYQGNYQGTWSDWAGKDACSIQQGSTSGTADGGWQSATNWKHALNVSVTQTCP